MRSSGGQEPDGLAPLYLSVLKHFQDDLAGQIDFQQMFVLIEGVLPFEVCLYYQVLPLFLDGSRMVLGMVSPYDRAASDYVRRLISYHHYTVTARQISSEALQAALSAYLNYAGQHQTLERVPSHFAPHVTRRSHSKPPLDNSLQPTLVVDSPEDLEDALKSDPPATVPPTTAPKTTPKPAEPVEFGGSASGEDNGLAPNLATPIEAPIAPLSADAVAVEAVMPLPAPLAEPESGATIQPMSTAPPDVPDEEVVSLPAPTPQANGTGTEDMPLNAANPSDLPPLIPPIPTLSLNLNYLSSPIDVLAALPPAELTQELLGRVLMKGIGRLYLERQANSGRVLWSQEGVLQSVLENLPAKHFQALINELKQVANLSTVPLLVPKSLDVERIFEHERILLRFRFKPSDHGEEATLQVLRGAALRFYQQQQLMLLERDALGIAKQLQGKLNELRDRAHAESSLSGARLEVLPALSNLLKEIETEIHTMQAAIATPDLASRRKPDA